MGQGQQQARFARKVAAGRGIGGDIGPECLDEATTVALSTPGRVAVQVLSPAHMFDHYITGGELVARRMRTRAIQLPAADGRFREIGRGGHISSGCSWYS